MLFDNLGGPALQMVRSGQLRALAVTSARRWPLLPDLPTTKELGFPSLIMENWYGVFLPAGTPKETRDKLEQALLAVVATPGIKQRFAQDGTHGALDHEAFAAMLTKQFAEWPERIKILGITGE